MASSNNLPQPQFLRSHGQAVYLARAELREHHLSPGTRGCHWSPAEVSQVRLGRSSNTFQQTMVQFFGTRRQGRAQHETHSWHLPGWARAPHCQGSVSKRSEWRTALTHCPVPFLPPLLRTEFTEVMESTRSVSAYLAVGNGSGLSAFLSTTSPPPSHSTDCFFWQTHLTM